MAAYKLIRPAQPNQILFEIYGELRCHSNVIVSACYNNLSPESLTRDVVYSALETVVKQHYALSIIPVLQPSEKQRGNHRVWEAQLNGIYLPDVVEFIDLDETDEAAVAKLLERTHNEWFEHDNVKLPRWKVKVVNGSRVVFTFDHFIADGISGYAFHRTFLEALNHPKASCPTSLVQVPGLTPSPIWYDNFPKKMSIFAVIYQVLMIIVIKWLFNKHIAFSDAKFDPTLVKWPDRFQSQERCQNSLFQLRTPSETQSSLLKACKAKGVTYTALLHTIILTTIARDVYPEASVSLTNLALNLRPYMATPAGEQIMMNGAGSKFHWTFLRQYRQKTCPAPQRVSEPADKLAKQVSIEPECIWRLSRSYMSELQGQIKSGFTFALPLSMLMIGQDQEDFFRQGFKSLPLSSQKFLLISNLGSFNPLPTTVPDQKATWHVTDVHFSSAAPKSNYGYATPVFNVAALHGGACTISVTMEEGILPAERIDTMLTRIQERLTALAELSARETSHQKF